MLKVANISIAFDERRVLDRLSLDLDGGNTLLLLGENGAGKTTLLSILAGMLRPLEGEVMLQGTNIHRTPAAKARIGYVGHQSMLHPGLTVRESLVWFARMLKVTEPTVRLAELADRLGLHDILDRRAGKLSRGESQRASIARAVVASPALLLLDEPFASLDWRGQEGLDSLIRTLIGPQRAIVLTTHQTELGLGLATHVARLDRGAVAGVVPRKEADELVAGFRMR